MVRNSREKIFSFSLAEKKKKKEKKMAVNFENEYVMLPQDRADHINERHVELNKERGASKFYRYFNLTATLAYLTRKTFRDSSEYEIIEKCIL